MPFKSQAQRGFMYANHPKLAAEFEAATPKGEKLPKRAKGTGDRVYFSGIKGAEGKTRQKKRAR